MELVMRDHISPVIVSSDKSFLNAQRRQCGGSYNDVPIMM